MQLRSNVSTYKMSHLILYTTFSFYIKKFNHLFILQAQKVRTFQNHFCHICAILMQIMFMQFYEVQVNYQLSSWLLNYGPISCIYGHQLFNCTKFVWKVYSNICCLWCICMTIGGHLGGFIGLNISIGI